MDVQQYLRRIQIDGAAAPDLAFLTQLQEQHLLTIPFENLSVINGEPIVLDEQRLFEKIVTRKRGGFCYEMNGLFHWLLAQLGFTVTRVAAGVYNSTRGEFGPTFDHMALLVQLDNTYLVDVGFGDSVRRPLVLPDGEATDISGAYRLVQLAPDTGVYILQQSDGTDFQRQYRFTDQPRALGEYTEMCNYHQSSPNSHFTQRLVCTLATRDGRLTLSDTSLTITRYGEKERIPIESAAEQGQILQTYFGINMES
jgi:N-hydroxyarylamine O-acetyltransferase